MLIKVNETQIRKLENQKFRNLDIENRKLKIGNWKLQITTSSSINNTKQNKQNTNAFVYVF